MPVGPVLDISVGVAAGSLVTGLFDPRFAFTVPLGALVWLGGLALVAQVAGWLLISIAVPRLPALETSVMLLLQPMATTVWAWLIFDERLSLLQWGGVALVLGGVVALVIRGSVRQRVEVAV